LFSVIFEVHPKPDQWDAYLGEAKMLRPELEQVDGFVDNIRYKSLSREGWILSLSGWRDEKSVVRWRTAKRHHMVQEKGRFEILLDYHLRVGQIIHDTRVPAGQKIAEQRLDETEVGEGTTVTFVDAPWPATSCDTLNAAEAASFLGFKQDATGLANQTGTFTTPS
jgi:heme-degrading monooxygenase HmoA